MHASSRAALAAALAFAATPVLAQGVGNRADLEEIIVTASVAGSLTAPTDAEARRTLERKDGDDQLVLEAGQMIADYIDKVLG